jgi:hypothetical protein
VLTLLERELSRQLGVPLRLALAEYPDPLGQSLAARAALQGLLDSLGEPTCARELAFPHPRYSLTHAGGVAVAAAVVDGDTPGIGVDLELRDRMDPRAGRLFLSPEEHARAGDDPRVLLRLWTAKESLFKADPRNRGRILADYRLGDSRCWAGEARAADDATCFRYASVRLAGGVLSAAVATRGAAS